MKNGLFDQLVESVKQMKAIEAGEMEPARVTRAEELVQEGKLDVAALRARFDLSQAKFAALLGISVLTDSEFCWRGLSGSKADGSQQRTRHTGGRVTGEKRAPSSAAHEPKTVGDLPCG
jgi:hypothetical protein